MDGILNTNKPWGRTSFSIVAMVRHLSGERRVGHAGTLDPIATGVLPVCLGQGTRIVEFLIDTNKIYRAQIELGVATDTYDTNGRITYQGNASGISREEVKAILDSFCGSILQTPPMYSAIKYQGKPLYELARAGITVERKSREVIIHSLELIGWQPPIVTIEVDCGKGVYIRSLAHDLGQALGCGASLKSLIRLRCGSFEIRNSVSIPQLENAFRYGYWQQFVHPIDSVLFHWKAMIASDDQERDIRNGRPLVLKDNTKESQQIFGQTSFGNRCRIYTSGGCLLGVLRFDAKKRHWQPEKVFCN